MSKNFDDAEGKGAAGRSGDDDRSRESEDKADQSESGDGDVTEKATDKAKEKAGEAIDSAGEKLKNIFKRG